MAALTEAESKTLAAEDKWFAIIRAAIEGEVQRLTQQLRSMFPPVKPPSSSSAQA